ncbi:NAD(P)H-binding protein [Cytobacillus gottheilii]|uniref:NAD(P)H-binding protein n=1 Tax=Cytobacillus gottheilii TaxID=859144 RepID=UPI002494117B|nr:NAD(P)H-binding protein [Cytobacillus gottheilii]
MPKTAVIAGATGLVGRELLQLLLNENAYEKVVALVRRPLEIQNDKLVEVVCDFNNLHAYEELFKAEDIFCCLGTTIKKAKTQEAMYKIDVEYPAAMAKLAHRQGVQHFILISSMNANPNSKIFYSRMKGELEQKIKELDLPAFSIIHPALLVGEREEFRLGEGAAITVYKLLSKMFSSSKLSSIGIKAHNVAVAMYNIAQLDRNGTKTYSSQELYELSMKNT